MIQSVDEVGHFQKILIRITTFLLGVSLFLVSICLVYMLAKSEPFLDALAFAVVLLVASIPIAMQVVCTTTMALGSRKLAEQKAIVARLSAIEELAGMNMLCSDKTARSRSAYRTARNDSLDPPVGAWEVGRGGVKPSPSGPKE